MRKQAQILNDQGLKLKNERKSKFRGSFWSLKVSGKYTPTLLCAVTLFLQFKNILFLENFLLAIVDFAEILGMYSLETEFH